MYSVTNLNWGGGGRSRDRFCLKSPVHRLSPKAKSPKPASQGLLRALYCCQLLVQGQDELGVMSWGPGLLGARIVRSLPVSNDLGKGAARGALAGGKNRMPVTKHSHDWHW